MVLHVTRLFLYSGDVERVTQIINGGQNGIKDRRERYAKAKAALV